MAHFAEIGKDNIVMRVVVVDDKDIRNEENKEVEALGKDYLETQLGGTWVQTSYNNKFRVRFAGPGMVWDEARNAFYLPSPFKSWVFNEETFDWDAPTAAPEDAALGRSYEWNEKKKQWEENVQPPSWTWDADFSFTDPDTGETVNDPRYRPPVDPPIDDNDYDWDEESASWVVRPSE